ncbi:MAG: cold shock domain-containing protein [Clostridiales bacterium]|nr:cold shock domain-containing protein [Clostridiales bacterium]
MRGTVKWYAREKGYGFIRAEDGREYFAHQSEIQQEGFRYLRRGESVIFTPEHDKDGRLRAKNVFIC